MQIQDDDVARLFSSARLKVYRDYAVKMLSTGTENGVITTATLDLYRWNVNMSATIMGYVAYVEVFVRNAIDMQLRQWLHAQDAVRLTDWIDIDYVDPLNRIRHLLNGDGRDHLEEARVSALRKQQSWRSDRAHPRHGDSVNRNDMFAQLTFGAWDGMLRQAGKDPELAAVLMNAFPNIRNAWALEERRMRNARLPGSDTDDYMDRLRRELADRLKSIRLVRNRAGHEENLLRVEFSKVRRDMLFVLGSLGDDCIRLALPDLAEPLKRANPCQVFEQYQ
ncbi:Ycg4K [Bifidobacterium goeldii]|uniref:Ycg4K n=1 Tax=Bifidobacterium goeldii TaxID=2306975 RepID=A0A430FLB3_9BIFI|nr:hypothetical protein [Bifidobacterium goeldii]RSX53684.1 Ycg4K [Bifidobacterium goeldii]